MPQNERTIQEDQDPVFAIIHRQTLSRHRTRTLLRELDAAGYVIVKAAEIRQAEPAPQPGFAAAVLAAAEKRG